MVPFNDEIIANMNRRDIPYRPIGTDPCGAFGTFTVTRDITHYCGADLFAEKGRKTKVFVMFSDIFPSEHPVDADRRPKGFDVRFFTREGDWDLLGNNIPVSMDHIPIPTDVDYYSSEMLWRHCAARSNLTCMLTSLMSDHGIPATFCHMDGYGSMVYSTINDSGERFWVRYHFKSDQGNVDINDEEARVLSMFNPNSHRDDLHDEIEEGFHPSWTMYMQVMDANALAQSKYDPFDPARIWDDGCQTVEVGVLELNRNPGPGDHIGNHMFDACSIVPGVGLSPSPDMGYVPKCPSGTSLDPYGVCRGGSAYITDDYIQAGDMFRRMTESQKCELVDNTVRRIADFHPGVVFRHTVHCYRADADYGGRIADALGIDVYDIEDLAELDEFEFLGITEYD